MTRNLGQMLVDVFQVRFHGRGGQGVVTAADLLAVAAFIDGHHAQSFPSFGSERMGAPVASFCRIDEAAIRTRQPVLAPDAVVVADPTLIHHVDVLSGLAPAGLAVVNSTLALDQVGLDLPAGGKAVVVPASDLARRHMGRPLPNAALLGALSASTGLVSLAALVEALHQRFSTIVAEGNADAATAGYRAVRTAVAGEVQELSGAGPA